MPELKGSGRVKNLSHAMSEDATLQTKVQSLLEAAETSTYNTLLSQTKDLLTQWTHTDNISASQTRGEMQILSHNYANAKPRGWRYRVYAYARDIAILENFAGREFSMYVNGEKTTDIIGTELSKIMQDKLEYLQDKTLVNLLAQDLYGSEVYDAQTGELNYSLTLENIESSFTHNQSITQSANLLSALIHRDGLSILENFSTDTLNDSEFRDALVTYDKNENGQGDGIDEVFGNLSESGFEELKRVNTFNYDAFEMVA